MAISYIKNLTNTQVQWSLVQNLKVI